MNPSNREITIRPYIATDQQAWDQYVENHPQGTIFHLTKWKNVIEKTYGHKTYYMMAVQDTEQPESRNQKSEVRSQKSEGRKQKPETIFQL